MDAEIVRASVMTEALDQLFDEKTTETQSTKTRDILKYRDVKEEKQKKCDQYTCRAVDLTCLLRRLRGCATQDDMLFRSLCFQSTRQSTRVGICFQHP